MSSDIIDLLNEDTSVVPSLININTKEANKYNELLNEYFLEKRLLSHYTTLTNNRTAKDTYIEFVNKLNNHIICSVYKSEVFYFSLNKIQYDFVKSFLDYSRIFISAPASFGKTTIAYEVIARKYYEKIIMIFPTNELIRENVQRAKTYLGSFGYEVFQHTESFVEHDGKKIFICTAENALEIYLLGKYDFDFIFIDEVYKFYKAISKEEISDSRTKIYRDIINISLVTSNDILLAGPYISSFDGLEEYGVKCLEFKEDLVYREIISLKKENEEFIKSVLDSSESISLTIKDPCKRTYRFIKSVNKKMLFYFSRKATLKRRLKSILKKLETKEIQTFDHTSEDKLLFDMLLQHIDENYNICDDSKYIYDSLSKGIVLNTADIPRYLVKIFMYFYNHTDLVNVIFSTSTIVEGVNTSTDVLIVDSYEAGRKHMTPFEIQNLNGRVSRIGHSLYGVIICPDNYNYDLTVEDLNLRESELTSDEIYISNDESLFDNQIEVKNEMEKEYSENKKILFKLLRHITHDEVNNILNDSLMHYNNAKIFYATKFDAKYENLVELYYYFTAFNQKYFSESGCDKDSRKKYSHKQAALYHNVFVNAHSFSEFYRQLNKDSNENNLFSVYTQFGSEVISYAFSKYLKYTCIILEYIIAENDGREFSVENYMKKFSSIESHCLYKFNKFATILEKNGVPKFIIRKYSNTDDIEGEVEAVKYCLTESNQTNLSDFEKALIKIML